MEKERVTGLREIRNEKEYEVAKRELDGYVKEYKWFSNKDKALAEIRRIIDKYMKRYEYERESLSETQEKGILNQVQLLQIRYDAISDDTFMPRLIQNITASLLSIEAYEARKEDRSLIDVIRGVAKGDETTREYLRKKYTLEFANLTGDVPGITNMNLTPMNEILENISKNYGLIGIEIPKEERSLTVTREVEQSAIRENANVRCERFLREQGLIQSTIETKRKEKDVDKNSVQEHIKQEKPVENVKVRKEKDEKGEIGE